jgi:hypothetical protein
MNWLVVLAAVAGSFAVMLVGLRLLAYYRGQVAEKKPRTKPHVEHFDWDEFQTEFTRSDAMVAYADRVWPYILGDRARYVPMLYLVIPAALTSSILVAFGVFAAYVISNGAPFALILLCLIAPLANLAQANFATQASPLNATMAAAVMVLAVFNAGYSFVGLRFSATPWLQPPTFPRAKQTPGLPAAISSRRVWRRCECGAPKRAICRLRH